jgi:hypothetical protein
MRELESSGDGIRFNTTVVRAMSNALILCRALGTGFCFMDGKVQLKQDHTLNSTAKRRSLLLLVGGLSST